MKYLKKTFIYKIYCKVNYALWNARYRRKLRKKAKALGEQIHLSKDYIFNSKRMKLKFYLPLYEKDLIQQSILVEDNYYEEKLLNYFFFEWNKGIVSKKLNNHYFCDIGSNIGNHALYFFKECNAKGGFIFEPIKDTFDTMKKNMEINDYLKISKLYNVGLCDKETKGDIGSYDINNTGGTTLELKEDGKLELITLDSLNIEEPLALLKIDTEGFEKMVIDGALETIKKHKPFIMIEIQENNFDYIYNKLKEIGYKYEKSDSQNCLFYIENN